MKTFKQLVEYHLDCGYWSTLNDQRYGYKLCPEPFAMEESMVKKLKEVSFATASYQKGMKNLLAFCNQESSGNDLAARTVRQICEQACDGLPLIVPDTKDIPIAKVDVMIDKDGNLKIAEIDSYNPRGIPVVMFLHDVFEGDQSSLIGVEKILENIVGDHRLVWMYAHRERFYLQVLTQMQRIFAKHHMTVSLHDAAAEDFSEIKDSDIIEMVPWGMNWKEEIPTRNKLIQMYMQSPEKFVYPLIPWMSTKGLMGVVSNASLNPQLEELARVYFGDHLSLLREHIPSTVILGRHFIGNNTWVDDKEFILKKNVSSGCKGIWLPGSQDDELQKAFLCKHSSYIAQEFVQQKTFSLPYYDDSGAKKVADWYLRITAYVGADGELLDAKVTGRKTPDVHGSIDSIMLPCVA